MKEVSFSKYFQSIPKDFFFQGSDHGIYPFLLSAMTFIPKAVLGYLLCFMFAAFSTPTY